MRASDGGLVQYILLSLGVAAVFVYLLILDGGRADRGNRECENGFPVRAARPLTHTAGCSRCGHLLNVPRVCADPPPPVRPAGHRGDIGAAPAHRDVLERAVWVDGRRGHRLRRRVCACAPRARLRAAVVAAALAIMRICACSS